MKSTGIINATALFLLLGMATPAIARQEKPVKQEEKAKPAQKEQQAKPEQRQEQAKAPKQQQAKPEKQQVAKTPSHQQNAKPEKQAQAKAPKQEQAKAPKQEQAKAPKRQAKAPKQEQAKAPKQEQARAQKQQPPRQQQAKYAAPPKRSQQEISRQRAQPALRLSARTSNRIPDDRFRSNFGSAHDFRIGTPVLVGGFSRFQYGGFWFGFVQPWPSGWYYTDDVYIDYVDGGYYMFNPYYPGVRFSISVVS